MTEPLNPWAQATALKKENEVLREFNLRLQTDCAAMAKKFESLRREVDLLYRKIDSVMDPGEQRIIINKILESAAQSGVLMSDDLI